MKLQQDIPPDLTADFKKWHDKEEAQKKEFQNVCKETFKVKQEAFGKTQSAIRFNKQVVNTTMATVHVCFNFNYILLLEFTNNEKIF